MEWKTVSLALLCFKLKIMLIFSGVMIHPAVELVENWQPLPDSPVFFCVLSWLPYTTTIFVPGTNTHMEAIIQPKTFENIHVSSSACVSVVCVAPFPIDIQNPNYRFMFRSYLPPSHDLQRKADLCAPTMQYLFLKLSVRRCRSDALNSRERNWQIKQVAWCLSLHSHLASATADGQNAPLPSMKDTAADIVSRDVMTLGDGQPARQTDKNGASCKTSS